MCVCVCVCVCVCGRYDRGDMGTRDVGATPWERETDMAYCNLQHA